MAGFTPFLWLPGLAASYGSAPDSAPLSITGDIDIRGLLNLDDWTPGTVQVIASKWTDTGNQRGYILWVTTTGALLFFKSSDGTANASYTSTATVSASDGGQKMCRATYNSVTGDVKFYTSDAWDSGVQLGSTRPGAASALFDNTAGLNIGAYNAGTAGVLSGKVKRVQIRNNILDDGTGIVFDEDFTTETAYATSVTEDSANVATVTINGFALITPQWGAAPIVGVASATDATSYASASWTPVPLKLYLVWVAYTIAAGATTPTLSGNGITWSLVTASFGSNAQLALFAGYSGASPSAGALTASFGAVTQTGCDIEVILVDGADLTGIGGIALQVNDSAPSSVSPVSLALPLAPAAASRCVAAFYNNINSAITPRANWDELSDAGHGTPNQRLETQWRKDASEQTASASGWAGSGTFRIIVAELKPASVAISSADTGAGADGQTAAAATFTQTETGAGAETGTIGVANADTATDVETESIALTQTDTSTGADAQTAPAATFAQGDTGSVVEAGALAAASSSSDTSSGVDAAAPAAATLPGVDTGSGSESGTNAATLAAAETSSTVESGSVAASVSSADTGTDAETESVAVAISSADTGTDAEVGSVAAAVSGSESGSDTETESSSSTLASADSSTGTEGASIFATIPGADTGSSSEGGATAAALAAAEQAVVAEAEAIVAAAAGLDSGSGVDLQALQATLSSADSGSGSAETGRIGVSGSETGTGVETGMISAELIIEAFFGVVTSMTSFIPGTSGVDAAGSASGADIDGSSAGVDFDPVIGGVKFAVNNDG